METQHPLKIERKLRGWSQSKIAEALGITTRTVSRWEQGLSVPYPYYREQLCALFGKNARELGMLSEDEENDIEATAVATPAVKPAVNNPVAPAASEPETFLVDPAIPEGLGSANRLLGRDNLLMQVRDRLV